MLDLFTNLKVDELEFDRRKESFIDANGKSEPIVRASKSEKRRVRYEQKLESYKQKKAEKKANKSEQSNEIDGGTHIIYENYLNKRQMKARVQERLDQVYGDTSVAAIRLKVCVDCSFTHLMSFKEMSRLAQQIGACYAFNKTLSEPVHLTLCNLDRKSQNGGLFYDELCRVNFGFDKYRLNIESKCVEEWSQHNIVYLSPDATEPLENVDNHTVYVIGGLVDETVASQVTLVKCKSLNLTTRSLPIEKYLKRNSSGSFNYNKILTINQVFEILANYFKHHDWPRALEGSIPKRKGFIAQ